MSYCETQSLAIGYGAPLLRDISAGRARQDSGLHRPQRCGQIHLIKNAGRAAGGPERRGIADGKTLTTYTPTHAPASWR